ncbi:protein NETWORKED 2D isoform X3 [Cinnamomum micranthum f. kanehirae]|uniref:Protein NETWORKED 2D isoform X3 n=1 Tax=Cinnamomum micranthum f. kanehirae TaxID=337451 RepID=A0A3S3QDX0_9MAGN|nr:protein NETWORKED 2D isoform X3 [Cinnamomum micranthum f. kanehirae]
MLQGAANSDSSWSWTSHLKSKRGKWLRLSLEDTEEKVKSILIVIEEDADSFGKRAEMYYKNRPELINFVEESYRAYRALADRYEHISGELQNANNTIANLFPDQVQLALEDDDENTPKPSRYNRAKVPKPPENPKFKIPPIKDMKKSLPPQPKNSQAKKTTPQMSKDEAHEKVDKIQKEILVLQTEKEFVKSSYESGLAQYWDIEKRIKETQERMCSSQDGSGADTVIEDNNAQALRTTLALKSCGGTLLQLQEQQERMTKEARIESKRVRAAKEKLKAFKERYLQHHTDNQETTNESKTTRSSSKNLEEEASSLKQERLELQLVCEKVREYFEKNPTSSHAVVEFAEMVDELVKTVASLERSVSSQTASIKRLRSKTDKLQKHLKVLDKDKTGDWKNLSGNVRELEEELHGIQDLNKSVEEGSSKLQTDFIETCCNLNNLSQKLQTPEKNDEIKNMGVPLVEDGISLSAEPPKKCQEQEDIRSSVEDSVASEDRAVEGKVRSIQDLDLDKNTDQENHAQPDITLLSKNLQDPQQDQDEAKDKNSIHAEDSVAYVELQKHNEEQTGRENWKNLFLNGLEEREKILLSECTAILQNYRETKKAISEVEKKNQESLYDVMAQIKELQSDNTKKDMEIQLLKQKLSIVQTAPNENMNSGLKKSEDLQNTRTGNTKEQWKYLFNELQKKSVSLVMPRLLEDLLKERNIDFATKSKELSGITSMENPTEDDVKLVLNEEPHTPSIVEEEFRRDIDGQLEENLEFWLRFSTTSHQIQMFQTKLRDLQEEYSKQNKDKKKMAVGANATDPAAKSEASSATEKKLRELHGELSVWLEHSVLLKNELQYRFSSLCKIQEDISRVSKVHSETEQEKFTSQQAARYQGEVMNMRQENNRVAEELEVGLDLVRRLQLEVEKTLSKSNEKSSRSGSKSQRRHQQQQVKHSTSRNKVPLRNFLFGSKTKKASLFSCSSSPIQKQYDMKKAGGGLHM